MTKQAPQWLGSDDKFARRRDPKTDTTTKAPTAADTTKSKLYPNGWTIQGLGTHLKTHHEKATQE